MAEFQPIADTSTVNPLAAYYSANATMLQNQLAYNTLGSNTQISQNKADAGSLDNQLASATLGSNTEIAANKAKGGDLANQFASQEDPLKITSLRQQLGLDPSPTLDRQRALYNSIIGQPGAPAPPGGAAANDGSVTGSIISSESGGDPNAKNSRSSASGAGQFIDGTWLDVLKRNRPDLAQGKSDAELLALKNNGPLSAQMTTAYANENATALSQAGLPASPTNIYLAHGFGAAGATKILQSDPNTPMESLVTPDVMTANPQYRGKTAGQVVQMFAGKMSGAGGTRIASQPSPGASQPSTDHPAQPAVQALSARIMAAPPEQRPALYAQLRPAVIALGANAPEQYPGDDVIAHLAGGGWGHPNAQAQGQQQAAAPGVTLAPDPSAAPAPTSVQVAGPGAPTGSLPTATITAPDQHFGDGRVSHLGDTGHAPWPAAMMATPEGRAAAANAAAADSASAASAAAKWGPLRQGVYVDPAAPVAGGAPPGYLPQPAAAPVVAAPLDVPGHTGPLAGVAPDGPPPAQPANDLAASGPPQPQLMPAASARPPAPAAPAPVQTPPAQPATGMNSPQVQEAQRLLRGAAQIELEAAATPNDPRAKATAAAMAADLKGRAAVLMQADSVTTGPNGVQTHSLTGKQDDAAKPAMNYQPDPNNPGVLISPGEKPVVLPPGRATVAPDGSTWITGPGGTFKEVRAPNLEGTSAAAAAAAGGTAAATAAAKTKDALVPLARTSGQAIGNIDYGVRQLDEALKGGIPTGYFADGLATAAAAAKSLGLHIPGVDPAAVSNIQTASKTLAVVSGAILQNILGPNAEITEGKIEAFIHAQPGITNDPQATHRILNWARSQFTYDHEMAMDGLAHVDPNSGQLPPGWQAGYITKHGSAPIFDSVSGEMKQPDGQGPSRESPTEAAVKPPPTSRPPLSSFHR